MQLILPLLGPLLVPYIILGMGVALVYGDTTGVPFQAHELRVLQIASLALAGLWLFVLGWAIRLVRAEREAEEGAPRGLLAAGVRLYALTAPFAFLCGALVGSAGHFID